jgi:hypothetical protein
MKECVASSVRYIARRDRNLVIEVQHTFRSPLLTVRLHGDMGVEVVQCAISLLTAIPSTLVHALNFFVTSARALVLLGAGNGNKGVNLRQMMLLVN